MNTQHTDVVAEYLADVDRRLGGLPLLQRRELLADLETHIAAARAEQGAPSQAELIEILERLGSPEEVAAAAYREAGPMPPPPPPPVPPRAPATSPVRWTGLVIGLVAGFVLLVLLGCAGLMVFAGAEDGPAAPPPAVTGR